MVIPKDTPTAADLFRVFLFQFEQDYQRSVNDIVTEGRLHALGHGAAIFLAFVLAGSVPLLPFALAPAGRIFLLSCVAAGVTLFAVGSLHTVVTRARWFVSGLEMLLVGAAAVAAYAIGHWLQQLSTSVEKEPQVALGGMSLGRDSTRVNLRMYACFRWAGGGKCHPRLSEAT